MYILILNGSPRPKGNTVAMINAFSEGAKEKGHKVEIINVCRKKIAGCLGCEYCHNREQGVCVQKDDMQEVYQSMKKAEVLILASPMYFLNISGQLQSAISRIYAIGWLPKLKKCGMFLSSRVDGIYDGIAEIHSRTMQLMGTENIGIITSFGEENYVKEQRLRMPISHNSIKAQMKLEELREFGRTL